MSQYVGRLEGRTSALEGRADRFEGAVTSKLASMDSKLDTQDAKIDGITAALAALGGRRGGWSDVFRWSVAIVTVAAAAIGTFLHGH